MAKIYLDFFCCLVCEICYCTRFIYQRSSKLNADRQSLVAEKSFIHEAAKGEDVKTNLNSSPGPEDRVQRTLQGKGTGWSETWEKVIGDKKSEVISGVCKTA